MLSLCFPISGKHDAGVAFSLLVIKASCNDVLNKCSERNNSDRSRGDICQTIVKKIKVVAVNKPVASRAVVANTVVANKEAAREIKAADKVAKKAAAVAASKATAN
jgi:hypothetical protein